MQINVHVFGPLAQLLGARAVLLSFDHQPITCGAIRQRLTQAEPRLAEMMNSHRLAVNHEFAPDEQPIHPNDEVALIGLVSGG